MNEATQGTRLSLAQPVAKLLAAALITGAYFIDGWGGSIPVFSELSTSVAAVTVGFAGGILLNRVRSEDGRGFPTLQHIFGIIVLLAIVVVFIPPYEFPVELDLFLLAAIWGSVLDSFIRWAR